MPRKRVFFLVAFFCSASLFFTFRNQLVSNAEPKAVVFVPGVTATKTAALQTDSNGNGIVNPGDRLRYTVTIANGGTDATGVNFADTIDANTTLAAGSLIVSPIAVNDSYAAIGNVGITVPAASGVLANDLNPNGGGTLAITSAPAASANGGSVSLNTTDGSFTYNPPVGFQGIDTFSYTLSNGTGLTDTATVSITVAGMIWFVNNNAAACTTVAANCGRLSSPFSTLAAFNAANIGGGSNPDDNDSIFIFESASTYSGAVTLRTGQKLIGQDATATLASIAGVTVQSYTNALPAMNGANGTITNITSTVTLNTNVTLRGFSINSGASTGVTDPAGAITGVATSEVSVATTTGTAVLLSNTGGTISFRSVSSNGGTNGISLTGTSGSFTVTGDGTGRANGSGGTIQNITGGVLGNAPVYLLTSSGTVTLNSINMGITINAFSGMLVDNNAGGTLAVNVTGCTFTGVGPGNVVQNKALLQFEAGNTGAGAANLTVNVQNSFFYNNRSYGMFATAGGDSTMRVTLNQSGFGTETNTGAPVNNPGTTITNAPPFSLGITNGNNAKVDYNVSNNTFWGARGLDGAIYAVTISGATTTSGSRLNGFFTNNRIGKAGVVGSGCANNCAGLGLLPGSSGTFNATVTGNDIRQVNSVGINYANTVGVGATFTSVAHIQGNTLAEPDTTGAPVLQRAIVYSPINSGGASTTNCAEIGDNTGSNPADRNNISGGWQASAFIRVTNQANTIAMVMPGYAGGSTDTAAVNAFLQNANTLTGGAALSTTGTAGIVGGPPCAATPPIAPPADSTEVSAVADRGGDDSSGEAVFMERRGNSWSESLGRIYRGVAEAISPSVQAHNATDNQPAVFFSGETISKVIGLLPAGESVTIRFDATIDATIPSNDFSVSNQGTISGSNFSNVLTDDPAVAGAANPTVTTVVQPPTLTKAFGATSVQTNAVTTLTFTIGNQNPSQNLTNIAFTDVLPAGMLIATPNGLVNNCGGGTVTATQGTGTFSVSALSRNAGTTCTIVVNVVSSTEGAKLNTTGTISSTQGGTGLSASATVTVIAAPSFSKSFGSPTIPLNGTTALSFTITNNSATSSLNGVSFTDNLPAGLVVATPANVSGSCGGGSITANPGATSTALSGAVLAPNANCTFSVDVTGTTAGVKNNAVVLSTTELGTGATASASVTVVAPPTIAKSFNSSTILQNNGFSTMTIAITNPAANSIALTGAGVVDNFPSGMQVSSTPNATNSCGTGTFAPAANAIGVSVSGATIPPNTTCNFTVQVIGTSSGILVNTTQNVSSANGGNGAVASATLTVTNTAVWTGATSSNWNTATNWTPNTPPDSGNDVSIPAAGVANNPTISATSVTVNSINLAAPRILTINAGLLLTVNNSCTINSTLTVAGAFSCGTFAGTGTVGFTGAASQNVPPLAYQNLTINNAAGVSLSGDTTVGGVLTLTNGNLNAGAFNLILGDTAIVSRTSGHVIGNLRKTFASAGSFTFPTGTANGFSPATVNVTAGAFPLAFNVRAVQGAQPVLNAANSLARFWTVSPTGGTPTANLTFNYLQSDVVGTEANYQITKVSGGTATRFPNNPPNVVIDTTNNVATINGVTSFSDWSLSAFVPTAANVGISGRVLTAEGRGVPRAIVTMTDAAGNRRQTPTNSFGYYRFSDVEAGAVYTLDVRHKRYRFEPRAVAVDDELTAFDFTAAP